MIVYMSLVKKIWELFIKRHGIYQNVFRLIIKDFVSLYLLYEKLSYFIGYSPCFPCE